MESNLGGRSRKLATRTRTGIGLLGWLPAERSGRTYPRLGFALAGLAALISGVAIWTNAIGVRTFTSPVLYTTLKNAFVAVVLLLPLMFSSRIRSEWRLLSRSEWLWLLALALTGGSFAFALNFTGLRMTTAATGSLIGHFEYVAVGVIAVLYLKERLKPAMWAGFGVLLIGLIFATGLGALNWNQGAVLIGMATIMYAVSWVIAKRMLRQRSTLLVYTALMAIGVVILAIYTAATGQFAEIGHLGAIQWHFVLIVGAILLGNNAVTLTAIRHAPVAAVMAIGTAAPIITTVLQVTTTGQLRLTLVEGLGLGLLLLAALFILVMGAHSESVARYSGAVAGQ